MGRLGDTVARATAAWLASNKAHMAGAAAIYTRTSKTQFQIIEDKLLAFSESSHAEDKLLPKIKTHLPQAVRVALYTYYSPCQSCIEKLLPLTDDYRQVTWKLGFAKYYSTDLGSKGSGVWANATSARDAVYRLIDKGWRVKIYADTKGGHSTGREEGKADYQQYLAAQKAAAERALDEMDLSGYMSP